MVQNYLKPNDNTHFCTEWNPKFLSSCSTGTWSTFFSFNSFKAGFLKLNPFDGLSRALEDLQQHSRLYSLYTGISLTHTHPSVTTKNVSSHSSTNAPWRAIFPLVYNYCFQTSNFLAPGHSHMSFFCKQNSSLDSTHSWLLLLLQISTKHLLFWDTFLVHSI